MKNIKRILNLILIIFVVLSTFTLTKSFAIVTDELEATGIVGNFEVDNMTDEFFRSQYDIFCCAHGVPAHEDEYRTITVDGNTYKPEDAAEHIEGSNTLWGFFIKEQKIKNDLPTFSTNHGYTIKNVIYTKVDEESTDKATPEEAYILAEMEENIYDKNYTRETLSLSETGNILEPGLLYADMFDYSLTIVVGGSDVKVVKAKNGNFYREEKVVEELWWGGTEEKIYWHELNMENVDVEFYDDKYSDHSYVQKAWWLIDWVNEQSAPEYKSPDGSKVITKNQLSDEAKAFESYILSITGASDVDSLNYTEHKYTVKEIDDSSGVEEEVVKTGTVMAPNIDYKFGWGSSLEDANVLYDSQTETYKIGPFSINYFEELYKHSSGREVLFAGITNARVISNIGDLTKDEDGILTEGEYAILHQSTGDINNSYPISGEEFYIVTPYKDGLKEIVDIEFSFKYMNAGAKYDYYIAEGEKEEWEMTSYCTNCGIKNPEYISCAECATRIGGGVVINVCKNCKDACSDCNKWGGRDCTCNNKENVYLERKSIEKTENVQSMADAAKAARWYEEVKINANKKWDTDVKTKGDLKIVKKVEDEDGNSIQVNEDKIFKFKVSTIRANEDGEYKNTSGGYLNKVEQTVSVKVEKGSSTGSVILPAEEWEGDKAPLYEVEEIEVGSVEIEEYTYSATKLEGGKGQYKENDSNSGNYEGAVVIATNIYSKGDAKYKKGKLEITKEVVDEHGNPITLSKEKVFEFEVKVFADTKEIKESFKIVVPKGSSSAKWVSSEYSWKEGNASYEIDEKLKSGYTSITPMPITGDLKEYDLNQDPENIFTKVTVQNKEIINKGKLKILKKLEDSEGNSYIASQDETFIFEVYVNGQYDRDVTITVPTGSSQAESDEIEYEWATGELEPKCKVVEKEHGTFEFISIDAEEKTLGAGGTTEFTVINRKGGTIGNSGTLKIVKNVDETVQVDTTFRFEYVIDGKREEAEITIPKGSKTNFWQEVFYWEGNAPTYEVKEIDIPSNYEFVKIFDSNEVKTNQEEFVSGRLKNNAEIVTVTAENKINDNEKGKIKIVKTLIDSEGNLFKADKEYKFEFDISVEGEDLETKSIIIKKGESEGYVFSKEYTWKAGEAPKYKVTETNSQGFEPTLTNAVGVLDDKTVEVTAVNKYTKKHGGNIKLNKKLIDENGLEVAAKETSSFYFRIFVTYDNGKESKEEVTLIINEGESQVESAEFGPYEWNEGETAPTFRVEEKTPTGEWKEIAIENDNNCLIAGKTVETNCYNSQENAKFNKGELQISKILVDNDGNEVKGKDFTFKVKVGDYPEETITVKSGDSWAKEYTWSGDNAPEYTVTETVPAGYELVSMTHKYQDYSEETGNSGKGTLKANNTVVVEVVNEFDESAYKGYLYINKILEIEDKLAEADIEDVDKTFGFKVTIYYDNPEQYFTYNGVAYNTLEIFDEIEGSGSIGPITIDYYEQGNGPKYVVEEISMPSGWQLVSTENANGKFTYDKENIEAKFVNRLPGPDRVYVLTMELGGMVWNDTKYSNGKPSDSGHDGKRTELEEGLANVIVKVYKKGASDPSYTLLTDSNGKWQIPTMDVPRSGEKYYVTYTYDGQTYEPTIPLVSGSVSEYSNEDLSHEYREKYLNDSMAIENSGKREDFNKEFSQFWGGNPIMNDGTTIGYAGENTSSVKHELKYTSKDIEYGGYSKKVSELITVYQEDDLTTPWDDTGTAKYPMTASTKNVGSGLYYPFNNQMALESVDKVVSKHVDNADIDGNLNYFEVIQYTYHAAYPYLNNINLGLIERPRADIAIEKDLEEAIVVVNGKIYKYKYGEIANTQFAEYPDLLYKQIQVNQKNINYTLNLYKSDYYYRASVYDRTQNYDVNNDGTIDSNDNVGNMLDNYLTGIGTTGLDSLNLDVYLTYKISVTNESDVYDVKVHKISDYVDSSLQLVTEDEIKYIDKIDGTPAGKVVVADGPTKWTWSISGNTKDVSWGTGAVETGIDDNTLGWRADSTEKVKYDRYILTGISDKEIRSGETVSSKLTFKVRKATDILGTGIDNCIQLGDKYNIVEIDSYSTYYTDGRTAGRVDEDSAPGNIDIKKKNSINWYEDDTDRSPLLKIGLYEQVRNINGIAWEDLETNTIEYSQKIGDGLYDETSEELIPNMTTTLVEKVTIDGIDYDFIWPTDSVIGTGTQTIQELTTFDSTTTTGLEGSAIGKGKYIFTGIPAGDYVVRFTYGDENTLDLNVRDDKGNIKYSGQDYKSTTYQAGNIVENDNYKPKDSILDPTDFEEGKDGFIDNEWHDLESGSAEDLAEERVSDARDDESRRLEVIAKSQNMFYENTSIMSTNTSSYGIDDGGTDFTRDTDDSLDTYYMESNTAKLNMNIESVLNSRQAIVDSDVGGVKLHVLNTNRKLSNDNSVNVKFIKYDVNNIDFGVETRSENNIKLDKQIEQITLKTSAGDILIDAIYNIKYENDDGSLRIIRDPDTGEERINPSIELNIASVGTENLQALNKTPGDLGFRYLNVDKDVLQGATITIKYRITALNTGEVDRCNIALINLGEFVEETSPGIYTYSSNLNTALSNIRNAEAKSSVVYQYGQYLGKVYYQGADYSFDSSDDKYKKNGIELDDAVVTSKVKQVIDYVDNDVVFSQMENINVDTSWVNTSTGELESRRLIDNTKTLTDEDGNSIIHILGDGATRKILDSNGVAYESEAKNNLIVSVENITGDTLANPKLIKPLTPYEHTDGTEHKAHINVTVSRYYSSDMDIEEVENIAETLKLYNDVGRRDLGAIQGNTKPALGPLNAAFGENDSSATELITLSPPTGTVITAMLIVQVMAVLLVAITILAGGIALIKRKVIIK